MRRVIARFLLLRFAGFFLFVLFTLTSLLVLFDLLAHADDLAVHHQGALLPMAEYAALRLPVLLTMIMPMSTLLAALVTFGRLATQYEIVALQSAGVSMYQICLIMLAGGVVVAGLHFSLAAKLGIPAEARLFRWAERDYAGPPNQTVLEPGAAWFAAGHYLVHIGNARDDGRRLDSVVVIERAAPNVITTYYEAQAARFTDQGWTLFAGWKQTMADGRRENFTQRSLPLALTPAQVMRVRLPVSCLKFSVLRQLAVPAAAAQYRTWFGRRLAEPLGSLVMILLVAPLGLQLKRGGRQLRWGALGVGLGFLFFIAERVMVALGANGILPPMPAVWAPLVVFGLVGAGQLFILQK